MTSPKCTWKFLFVSFRSVSMRSFAGFVSGFRTSRKLGAWTGDRFSFSVARDQGCFPFTKRFRKFRSGCKWNMIFRFVPLENFQKKWNFLKGSPVFPLEIFRWNWVFHLRVSQRFTSSRPLTTISSARKYGGYSFS